MFSTNPAKRQPVLVFRDFRHHTIMKGPESWRSVCCCSLLLLYNVRHRVIVSAGIAHFLVILLFHFCLCFVCCCNYTRRRHNYTRFFIAEKRWENFSYQKRCCRSFFPSSLLNICSKWCSVKLLAVYTR